MGKGRLLQGILFSVLSLCATPYLAPLRAMHPAPDRRYVVAADTLPAAKETPNQISIKNQVDNSCVDWLEAYKKLSLLTADTTELVDIYTNVATLLEGIENYDYATEFLEKAYRLCETRSDTEKMFQLLYAMIRIDIATANYMRAEYNLRTIQKLEHIANKNYRDLILADTKGLFQHAMKHDKLAAGYFRAALYHAKQMQADERFSELHTHLATALKALGQTDLANQHLDSALDLVPPIRFNGEIRSCDITRATVYTQMEDIQMAKNTLYEALDVARKARNRWLEAQFSLRLGRILRQEQDYTRAYQYLSRAQHLSDSLNLAVATISFKLYDERAILSRNQQEAERNSLRSLFFQNKSIYARTLLIAVIGFSLIFLLISLRSYRRLRKRGRVLRRQCAQNAKRNSDLILSFAHTENLRMEVQYKNEQQETVRRSLLYKNSLIMNSIEYANTIQRSLRPPQDKIAQRFPDHCIIYRPNNIVSGDLLWFSDLPTQSIFVLADCSGHEVAGAALSFIAYMKLNQIIREDHITHPTQIISAFAKQFYDLWKNSTDNFKMQSNVKMGVVTIDHNQQKLCFSGASQSIFYSINQQPVTRYSGAMHTISLDTNFTTKEECLELDLRDYSVSFYMMTDGFIEQPNKDNIKIGSRHVQELLTNIVALPMATQRQRLLSHFARHHIGVQQVDDVSILGLRVD